MFFFLFVSTSSDEEKTSKGCQATKSTRYASLAQVDLLLFHALLALDHAAPDDLALAGSLDPPMLHVVAAAAADGLAAVVGPGADPPAGAGGKARTATEAGRLLHVHQLPALEGHQIRGGLLGQGGTTSGVPPLGQLCLARGFVGVGSCWH